MLVVKTAKAAANPALARVDFGLTGKGVSIAETRGGGAEATDAKTGEQVFHTDTAAMWDSSPATGENPADNLDPLRSVRDARVAAGRLGGHRSKIAVEIHAGKQSLTLDKKLLTAKSTKYPVFVDPYWSGNPTTPPRRRVPPAPGSATTTGRPAMPSGHARTTR
jgi:hypothetical protein